MTATSVKGLFSRPLLVGPVLAGALLLAACGSDDEGSAGQTRMFQDMEGMVEVPADPQRIVALTDQNAMLPLLELGVTPVASNGRTTPTGEEFFRRVDEFDTSSVEWIGNCCDANIEAVAAQRPDLIVTDSFAGGEQLDQLREIAPVVRIDPFEQPLADALSQWADLVGQADEGAEFRSAYEGRINDLLEAIGDPAEITVAVVSAFDGGSLWYYEDTGQATGQVIGDLALARPDQWDVEYQEFSLEQFPDHMADYVIVYDFGGRETPDEAIDAFVDSPVFQAHPAVVAGQWQRIDATQTVGSGWTKLSNLLDVLEPILTDPTLDRTIDP